MTDRALQRMIFAACRTLGLDDETRREVQLIATGKPSLSGMTDAEMVRVVDALKARGFRPEAVATRGRKPKPAAERGDVRYCHVLWRLLAQAGAVAVPGRAGLNAFVRARFEGKWGSVPIDIDALSDWRQIADVATALKAMCKRAGVVLEA